MRTKVGTPNLATFLLISEVVEVVVIENNLQGLVKRSNLVVEAAAEEVIEEETEVVIGTTDKEEEDIVVIEGIVVVEEEAEVVGVVTETKVVAGVTEETVDPLPRGTTGGKRNQVTDTMEVEEEIMEVVEEDARMTVETVVEAVEVVRDTAMIGQNLDPGTSVSKRSCSIQVMDPLASISTDTRIFQWR